jgi:transposase
MGMVKQDDGWRLPQALWEQMAPLLPPRKLHPLGCHNPRVDDRNAMNAILFVLRTGCQWNALNGTGICSSSSAHRRFQEWAQAGVFEEFWRLGLLSAAALEGIDWSWLSLDGAMTKAPLGGEKNRAQSDRSRQRRRQAQPADGSARHSAGRGSGWRQPA